jgi:hypothetical protein
MIATVVDSTSRMIAQLHADVFRDVGAPDVQARPFARPASKMTS